MGRERDEDQEQSLQETSGGPRARCDNTRFRAVVFRGSRDGCVSAQEGDEEARLSPGAAVHRVERKEDQPSTGGGASRQTGVGSRSCHRPEVGGHDLLNGERCRHLGFGDRCWERPARSQEMLSLIRCREWLLLPRLWRLSKGVPVHPVGVEDAHWPWGWGGASITVSARGRGICSPVSILRAGFCLSVSDSSQHQ